MNQGTSLGSQIGRWILLAALAVALGALLLTIRPAGAQDDSIIISYAENGTNPVTTLTATDPEMDTITWSVTSTGTEDFAIDSKGVLTFSAAPDYEAPAGGSADDSNTYVVLVTATDTASPANTDTFTVIVQVTNMDEDGKVTWTTDANADDTVDDPTLVQFEVGSRLTATATDGDISGTTKTVVDAQSPTWKWYRGETQISGANTNIYNVVAADVDSRLRVEVTYRVAGNADSETASLTSDYPVLATRTGNTGPRFSSVSLARESNEGEKGMAVGAPVTATDDGPGKLNYALGGADETKFKIDQKTGQITTNVDLDYDTADADNCRDADACTVTVTATDSAGTASDPVATVTIRILNVNDEKPAFTDASAGTTASIAENTTEVSATAYAAEDGDGDSVTLSLMGVDKDLFMLNAGILSFKSAPDFENPTDMNKDNVYEVTVRASDGTMYMDRMVKVTVTDVNEAPMITGDSAISYAENGTDPVTTLTATDPEMDTITWSVTSTGTEDFAIDSKGVLRFSSPPDYEEPLGGSANNSNTYEVVVTGTDGTTPDTFTVIVQVTNMDEPGKVTWATAADGSTPDVPPALVQFEVGSRLTATATDEDISGGTKTVDTAQSPTWKWYRGGTQIGGANTNIYTVAAADVGSRIRVEVTYRVAGNADQETASLTSDYPVLATRTGNTGPSFTSVSLARQLNEGEKGRSVGAPVRATDDGPGKLNYTLGGADETKFKIDQKTGQITTEVDLNYEGSDGDADQCATANTCTVTVTATDSASEDSATAATVTINILNVNDEKPAFTDASAGTTASIAENTTEVSATAYAAEDGDGDPVTLSLMGVDKDLFMLNAGILSFKSAPDFENPTDMNKDNVYEVTVRASDGTMYMDRMVRVTVTDANEAPMVSAGLTVTGDMRLEYTENGTGAVGTYMAAGPGSDMATWTVSGDDMGAFSISGGMLMFRSSPDYENPTDMDTDNVYMVTVVATYGDDMGERDVMVTVTNANDPGMVTGLTATAAVGDVLTADVDDDDGVTAGSTTWQWTRNGANIEDATSASYTVTSDDAETALRAMATYTDETYGAGMTATGGPVMIDPDTAVARYDSNNDGMIDLDEMFVAIDAYFDDPAGFGIDELFEIIDAYFASNG